MRSRIADATGFPFALTDDAVLGGRLQLLQPARGHRAGHDAILLAAAATGRAQHAFDLGAGIGTAGLALLARGAARNVAMLELDPDLVRLAELNAERNGFSARATVMQSDVERIARRGGVPGAAGADLVIMNPPFNDPARHRASPLPARRRAHAAPDIDLEIWLRAADRLLKAGGRVVLIHRPEALAAMLGALNGRFGAAELIPIHARAREPAIRLIVRAQKGKRTPLSILPGLVLADESGRASAEAEAVLRGAAALAAPSPAGTNANRMAAQRAGH
jgi:tRNA1(Val) A37 N6-methylase TrmN6